jgi:ribosomal protein L17
VAHRIGGRKLSRKGGPRLSLFKNLTVSVIRYERVKTTEAKAKEISGRVEKMISLAKRGDIAARRSVVAQLLALQDEDLLRMRNFGKKSLDEMKERLRMRGFLPPDEGSEDTFESDVETSFDDEDDEEA